ncbi:MAG: hypothetical protein ACPGGK_13060 [Pikeienuella sp.]
MAKMKSRVASAESKAESELATALAKLDGLPKFWPLVGTIILALVSAIGLIFGILSFAGERFDGGLSASSIVDEVEDRQRVMDARQDEILLQILKRLPENVEPETSPKGQD